MYAEGMSEWVNKYRNGREFAEHLDGVVWYDAPAPKRWHRCTPQSRAFLVGEHVEHCACGGLRFDGHGIWIDRNQRIGPSWFAQLVAALARRPVGR